jgi:hypothetical protein
MRPWIAHRHLGLGRVYRFMGKEEETHERLSIAATICREMESRHLDDRLGPTQAMSVAGDASPEG